ncbi:MAG TPA: CsgG/HfaB family protein [Vicinamibacterales bacterium]|jgi:curli biogenesis system outer membrane secretion channel CsgG|nr:CsgG/HfaB family protein [Vicinamibacterales bacterium]
MKKVVTCAAAALLLVAGAPRPGYAQAKIKIAIWEFENHAEMNWWFYKDMGPAARNQIDTEFSENKLLSDKFSVIERDKLNLVLKEQGLGQSGAVDPASAAKVGKILGVKYILLGGIDKFNIDKTGGAIGKFGVGGNMVQSNVTINMRLIDTTTAERVLSLSADANVKKGGGFVKSVSGSRESEWGIASETIQKAAKAVVEKFVTGDYLARIGTAAHGTGSLEGKIIRVEGTRAYINLGAEAGIKVGDKFAVFNLGEALVDPDTGAKLGADEKRTGDGTVVEVQPKFAVITVSGKAAAKDTVRKQ